MAGRIFSPVFIHNGERCGMESGLPFFGQFLCNVIFLPLAAAAESSTRTSQVPVKPKLFVSDGRDIPFIGTAYFFLRTTPKPITSINILQVRVSVDVASIGFHHLMADICEMYKTSIVIVTAYPVFPIRSSERLAFESASWLFIH